VACGSPSRKMVPSIDVTPQHTAPTLPNHASIHMRAGASRRDAHLAASECATAATVTGMVRRRLVPPPPPPLLPREEGVGAAERSRRRDGAEVVRQRRRGAAASTGTTRRAAETGARRRALAGGIEWVCEQRRGRVEADGTQAPHTAMQDVSCSLTQHAPGPSVAAWPQGASPASVREQRGREGGRTEPTRCRECGASVAPSPWSPWR
jgi:hypothetical protein